MTTFFVFLYIFIADELYTQRETIELVDRGWELGIKRDLKLTTSMYTPCRVLQYFSVFHDEVF